VKIRIKRSGGFAGISTSSKIDSNDLPPKMLNTIGELMTNSKSAKLLNTVSQKGVADDYQYLIEIKNGVRTKTIKCSQFNVGNDLRSVIKYIEQFNREKK
jgi:hypothetical protein